MEEKRPAFKVIYSDEVLCFLESIPTKVRKKITSNIESSQFLIRKELFKKLTGTNLWEFRTLYDGIQYRILAFWDKRQEALVITTHGFLKKTDKTPLKEIVRAEEYRKKYFEKNK